MTAPELSERQLAEIEAQALAATAGPWVNDLWEIYGDGYDSEGHRIWIGESCDINAEDSGKANAAHIAGMDLTTTLALVATVRRLQGDVARVREVLHGIHEFDGHPDEARCIQCDVAWPCPTIAAWRHSVTHPANRSAVLEACAITDNRLRCTCVVIHGRQCCAYATQEDRQCDECRVACAAVEVTQ